MKEWRKESECENEDRKKRRRIWDGKEEGAQKTGRTSRKDGETKANRKNIGEREGGERGRG